MINDGPIKCNHETTYYNAEHDNYYCSSCKQGMGFAYYKIALDLQIAEDKNKSLLLENAQLKIKASTFNRLIKELYRGTLYI